MARHLQNAVFRKDPRRIFNDLHPSRDSIHAMKIEAHITYVLLDVSGKEMDATDLAGHLVTIGLPKGGAIQHLRDITNEEYTFLVTDIKEFWPDAPYQWQAEVTLQLVG